MESVVQMALDGSIDVDGMKAGKVKAVLADLVQRARNERRGEKPSFMAKKQKNEFQKALSNQEWARFYNRVAELRINKSRIGKTAVLLYNDNYSGKIICFKGGFNNPVVTAVFEIDNYDYSLHDKAENIAASLAESVKNGYSEEFIRLLLDDAQTHYSIRIRRYSTQSASYSIEPLYRNGFLRKSNVSDNRGENTDLDRGDGAESTVAPDNKPDFKAASQSAYQNRTTAIPLPRTYQNKTTETVKLPNGELSLKERGKRAAFSRLEQLRQTSPQNYAALGKYTRRAYQEVQRRDRAGRVRQSPHKLDKLQRFQEEILGAE